MFENIAKFLKKFNKNAEKKSNNSKEAAKERLHLVLMQDRANVSADFLELMKQEIIEVIKKYIDVDEKEIDVRLTNKENADGTNGAPALYANIPIVNIKNEVRKIEVKDKKEEKPEKAEESEKVKEEKEKPKKEEKDNQEKEEQKKEAKPSDEIKKDENGQKNYNKQNEKIKVKNNAKEKSKVRN